MEIGLTAVLFPATTMPFDCNLPGDAVLLTFGEGGTQIGNQEIRVVRRGQLDTYAVSNIVPRRR